MALLFVQVVFGGFSSEALAQRITDCGARVVLTASAVMRGAKRIDLKAICDDALRLCGNPEGATAPSDGSPTLGRC